MFLLAWLLIFELHLACALMGGQMYFERYFMIHWDLLPLSFILVGIAAHVLIFGRKQFLPGLKAILKRPRQPNPEIAAYFHQLTWFTILLGTSGMAFFALETFADIREIDHVGAFMAASVLVFVHAGNLALLVFWPIAVRFETGADKSETGNRLPFPVGLTVMGIVSFFLTRAVMAMLFVSMVLFRPSLAPLVPIQDGEANLVLKLTTLSINPADWQGDIFQYWHPQIYYDTPSLMLILLSLGAFRLAAGPLKNRKDWIPISILFGVLWSLEGFICMLSDLDPDKLSSGTMVALLTALYGFIAAIFFLIGSRRLVFLFFLFWPVLVMTGGLCQSLVQLFSGTVRPPFGSDFALAVFLILYALFLAVFLLTALDGVRSFRRRFCSHPEQSELLPEESQARQLLDEVVEKERRKR